MGERAQGLARRQDTIANASTNSRLGQEIEDAFGFRMVRAVCKAILWVATHVVPFRSNRDDAGGPRAVSCGAAP